MGAAENAEAVQANYEAFGAGDIEAVLAFTADAVWENFEDNPFRGTFKGREGVMEFLGILDETTDQTRFEVERIIAEGDTVVAIVDIGYTVKATGKASAPGPTVHIYEFEGDRPVRVREVAAGDGGAWEA